MDVPNFDDVDLGIIGIIILGVVGLLVGMFIVFYLKDKADTSSLIMGLFAFAGQCITGIAALVRGLKRKPTVDPAPLILPED